MDDAQRTITEATFKAILLALLVLAITAWAITWPVRRLTAGARRLAAGDLSTRVRGGGASEVDELAQAFNQMASELDEAERAVRSYQAQLEARVEERTLQLRHLAEHDPLTNLPNRRQLFPRLNEMICDHRQHTASLPCCSSISTTSRRSTTAWATSSATGC